MAKNIQTRLMLKHDSLTNWNESSLVLKPGEVGVAYVDVATRDAKGNIIHVPTALMKVGENVENSTKTFKDLPFMSALAADVYAWAKENAIYVEETGTGEVVAGIEWKATETHPSGALVITRTDVVTPNELTTALADYYTKGEIDTIIAGYYAKGEVDNLLNGKVDKTQKINGHALSGDVTLTLQDFAPTDNPSALSWGGDFSIGGNVAASTVWANSFGYKSYGDKSSVSIDEIYETKTDAAQKLQDAKDYTDTEINKIVTGSGYATTGYVDDAVAAHDEAVDTKLEAYRTSADQDVIDNAQNEEIAKKATLDAAASFTDVTATSIKIGDKAVATEEYADGAANAVKTGVENGTIKAADATHADAAAKVDNALTVKVGGADVVFDGSAAQTADVDTAITNAIAGKANSADVYTKDEANAEFATPAEVITEVNKALAEVSGEDSITNITTLVTYVNENAADLTALITEVYGAAEMTGDSRIDTAIADSAQAKADAAAAVGTANSASTIAGEAKTLAEEAKEAATNATTGAAASATAAADSAAAALASQNAAAGSAGEAAGSASAAAASAGEASASATAAGNAQSAAEAAQGAAETAAANAGDAQTAAETAQGKAEAAQGAAEQAKADAESARDLANGYKADAEAAKGAAEAAQTKAEAAQEAAEAAQTAAEASNTSATAIANEAKQAAEGAVATANTASQNASDALAKVNSLTTDDIEGGTQVWVFDCGTSSTVI